MDPSPGTVQDITSSLPPRTDYLTYLTILESHLTKDLLPTLLKILQEHHELTCNIGWDLVSLLVPLLPASVQCLHEVAQLGNPREVVLKITEALRQIDFGGSQVGSENTEDGRSEDAQQADLEPASMIIERTAAKGTPANTNVTRVKKVLEEAVDTESADSRPISVLQFTTLLSLLSIVHPRIKTKFPSRFLSSTLQAVLATYTEATRSLPQPYINEVTHSVVHFVKTVSGTKRPHLPPRKSAAGMPQPISGATSDPEAHEEAPSEGERAISKRLLQSFITHIFEDYFLALSQGELTPGLAWAARFEEHAHPEKIVPGRPALSEEFSRDSNLQARESVVGQLAAVGADLDIERGELLEVIQQPSSELDESTSHDEYPSSAPDIPLSKLGSLFLFVARVASVVLFGSPATLPSFDIMPNHDRVVRTFIGTAGNGGLENAGTESDPIVDGVLALGLWAYNNNRLGDLSETNDMEFTEYLQRISLLSARNSSPILRYQAHVLCSAVLHAHPSDLVRLAFIRDTLEHCPLENLKASAVGWLKEEILESRQQRHDESQATSVFATPVAIQSVASCLFEDISVIFDPLPVEEAWSMFQANFTFYTATLNFYYLLLSANDLQGPLDVLNLHTKYNVEQSFLRPLHQLSKSFHEALEQGALGTAEGDSGNKPAVSDLDILNFLLDRVHSALEEQKC